jgi:hypothetical protein
MILIIFRKMLLHSLQLPNLAVSIRIIHITANNAWLNGHAINHLGFSLLFRVNFVTFLGPIGILMNIFQTQ